MRASCGESTSKVACEVLAFYNFVGNSINWYVSKGGSRYFVVKCSCKPIAYRNTTKNELLTKFF